MSSQNGLAEKDIHYVNEQGLMPERTGTGSKG